MGELQLILFSMYVSTNVYKAFPCIFQKNAHICMSDVRIANRDKCILFLCLVKLFYLKVYKGTLISFQGIVFEKTNLDPFLPISLKRGILTIIRRKCFLAHYSDFLLNCEVSFLWFTFELFVDFTKVQVLKTSFQVVLQSFSLLPLYYVVLIHSNKCCNKLTNKRVELAHHCIGEGEDSYRR